MADDRFKNKAEAREYKRGQARTAREDRREDRSHRAIDRQEARNARRGR